MEALREKANDPEALQSVRRGWKLGGEDFLDWILERIEVPTGAAHPRPEREETEEGKAKRILGAEMKQRGWTQTQLKQRAKGDPAKVELARRLRAETTVGLKWIAQNLHMETSSYIANRLYHTAR